MQKTIQTHTKVILKQLEPADAGALFALTDKNRSYLREWLPWLDRTTDLAGSAGFIDFTLKDAVSGAGYVYGIWSSDTLVGVCSFQSISKANRQANIGYWISKDQAGNGFAKLATKTLIRYGFDQLKLHRIEIRCATGNIGSQKVAEGCGLKFEGISRDNEWLYDQFVSHRVYAILKTDVLT